LAETSQVSTERLASRGKSLTIHDARSTAVLSTLLAMKKIEAVASHKLDLIVARSASVQDRRTDTGSLTQLRIEQRLQKPFLFYG
jgi:hypothetical protein